jgi:hypothetical protein
MKVKKQRGPGVVRKLKRTSKILKTALFLGSFYLLFSVSSDVAHSNTGGVLLWSAGKAMPEIEAWVLLVTGAFVLWMWSRHKIIGSVFVGGLLGCIVGVL